MTPVCLKWQWRQYASNGTDASMPQLYFRNPIQERFYIELKETVKYV